MLKGLELYVWLAAVYAVGAAFGHALNVVLERAALLIIARRARRQPSP